MTSSVTSPADMVNLSLVRIGWKGPRVGDLYEGSEPAKAALTVYAETRDELLRAQDWGFAERNVSLTLLKQAPPGGYFPPIAWGPTYPPLPWLYEYTYPSDCLKVRSVRGTTYFVPNFDPQPRRYSVENDNSYSPAVKVILCNVPSAILTYTGQITDPATWEADFIDAFAAALGRRLAPVLVNADIAKMEAQDEAASEAMAIRVQG